MAIENISLRFINAVMKTPDGKIVQNGRVENHHKLTDHDDMVEVTINDGKEKRVSRLPLSDFISGKKCSYYMGALENLSPKQRWELLARKHNSWSVLPGCHSVKTVWGTYRPVHKTLKSMIEHAQTRWESNSFNTATMTPDQILFQSIKAYWQMAMRAGK